MAGLLLVLPIGIGSVSGYGFGSFMNLCGYLTENTVPIQIGITVSAVSLFFGLSGWYLPIEKIFGPYRNDTERTFFKLGMILMLVSFGLGGLLSTVVMPMVWIAQKAFNNKVSKGFEAIYRL